MRTYSHDLTTGPVFQKLIRFSIPIVLASFLQSIYGLVDMVVTGQFCGADGLSGVSNGSMVTTMLTFIAMGLSTGGNVVVGQYFGAKNEQDRKEAASTAMGFLLLLGLCLSVLLFAAARPVMMLIGAPALEEAVAYLRICAVGIFFIFGYNGLFAIIRAVGDSRTPLLITLLSAVANVGLDVLLIAVVQIGVAGAAIATVASQIMSFFCALFHTQCNPAFFGFTIRNMKIYRAKLILILKIGIPNALLFCINGLTHLLNTALVNGYGVAVSAGYGVSTRITDLCAGFITAMMNASSTMVAQCTGARLYGRVRRVLRANLMIALVISAVLGGVVYFGAAGITRLFNRESAVVEAGVFFLHIAFLQPLTYSFFTSLHAVATGAGDAKLVMWNSILGMAVPRVIFSLALNSAVGLAGIAWSCILAPLCAVPAALWYYKTNRWQHSLC